VVRACPVVLAPAFMAGVVLLPATQDNAAVARNPGALIAARCMAELLFTLASHLVSPPWRGPNRTSTCLL
jgi:hypothetical protein